VVCLTGVGSGGRTTGLSTADVAAEVVLQNNVIVGSVNANKRHWYKAGQALARADRSWLGRLVTRSERPEDFAKALQRGEDDIKVVVQFAEA
jgi:threonine dehydrogenase-like Zn-dependent dehydrogenase